MAAKHESAIIPFTQTGEVGLPASVARGTLQRLLVRNEGSLTRLYGGNVTALAHDASQMMPAISRPIRQIDVLGYHTIANRTPDRLASDLLGLIAFATRTGMKPEQRPMIIGQQVRLLMDTIRDPEFFPEAFEEMNDVSRAVICDQLSTNLKIDLKLPDIQFCNEKQVATYLRTVSTISQEKFDRTDLSYRTKTEPRNLEAFRIICEAVRERAGVDLDTGKVMEEILEKATNPRRVLKNMITLGDRLDASDVIEELLSSSLQALALFESYRG